MQQTRDRMAESAGRRGSAWSPPIGNRSASSPARRWNTPPRSRWWRQRPHTRRRHTGSR